MMKIAVIGAGASGMMAAETASGQGAHVTVFESNDREGKKLLLTGSGKCNLTHTDIDGSEYHGSVGAKADRFISRFGSKDTIEHFSDMGLMMYDRDGYIYPYSFQSFSVNDVLKRKALSDGIRFEYGVKVTEIVIRINKEKDCSFSIISDDVHHKVWTGFDRIIISCGGEAAPKTGSDGSGYNLAKKLGHTLIDICPALCGIECSDKDLKKASKIRQRGAANLYNGSDLVASDVGEIQFTDHGLSGIPVFNISRYVSSLMDGDNPSKIICSIDTVPDMKIDLLSDFLIHKRDSLGICSPDELLEGTVSRSVADVICGRLCVDRGSMSGRDHDGISNDMIMRMSSIMKSLDYHVTGTRPFSEAQTSTGGIGYDEITDDLESRIVPGIYFTGEMLDIDGPCGGYNLQWAWTSGWIAGMGAAGR